MVKKQKEKEKKLKTMISRKKMSKNDFHREAVNMSLEVKSMFVVLLMESHKVSDPIIKTFAILESCSQVTFAKENLLIDLDI